MIDVRLMNLYKLHIPKTKSFKDLTSIKKINDGHLCYFTMGNYDLIDIVKIDVRDDKNEHLLSKVYSKSREKQNSQSISSDDYTMQKILLFTDYGTKDGDDYCFTQDDIESFWNDKDESHIFFVSMLHIEDNVMEDIDSILKKITRMFGKKECICYFTLDYSDIVIFCKYQDVNKYMKKINELNYSGKEQKLIRDSFTIYGICRSYLLKQLEKFKRATDKSKNKKYLRTFLQEHKEFSFFAKINISVRNYAVIKNLRENLDSLAEEHEKLIYINQFGRHDFSIININATIEWLIIVEYLIDKETSNNKKNFWTFEAFIGSKALEYNDVEPGSENSFPTELLKKKCMTFKKIMGVCYENAINYYTPVCEVENSIRSITKNGFADDFILCIYESFFRFVEYITNKAEENIKEDKLKNKKYMFSKQFNRTFNNYFRGLISLANSGMHADRSFIQATDFNAVIYDIPPKLMSFYTVIVYKIIDIMRDNDSYHYAFLFMPNFSNDIIVETISYENIALENRLYLVAINENFFYNPPSVIQTMAHESAHFAGNKKRNREERFDRYLKCCIFYALNTALPKTIGFDSKLIEIVNNIYNLVKEQLIPKTEELKYICYFDELRHAVFLTMSCNDGVHEIIKKYLQEYEDQLRIELTLYPVKNKANYVLELYKNAINLLENSETVENHISSDQLGKIAKLFSETYADVQMVILLDMQYGDYLKKFIVYEKIIADDSWKGMQSARMAIVIRVMLDVGVWSDKDKLAAELLNGHNTKQLRDNLEAIERSMRPFRKNHTACNIISLIKEHIREKTLYDNNVGYTQEITEMHVSPKDGQSYYYAQVYLYLLRVYLDTLKIYNDTDKWEKIVELRERYSSICRFESIKGIYTDLKNEIAQYKENIAERLDDVN